VSGFAFLSILISTQEAVVYAPFKSGALSDILKSKGQNLDELFNERFTGLSSRDKELAYIYLRKKFKAKNKAYTIHTIYEA
jgi:hypothetical protein